MAHRVRAAVIVIRGGHVLAVLHGGEEYWSLPGGAIVPGETSEQAALRELEEETGARGGIPERLVFIVENHFTHLGERIEEFGFYYLVRLSRTELPLKPETFPGGETRLTARWLPLADLHVTDLRPWPLRRHLSRIPLTLTHIVNVEGNSRASAR